MSVPLLLWVVILAELSVIGNSYGDCKYKHCFLVNSSANSGPGSFRDALTRAQAHKSSVEIRLLNGFFKLPVNGVALFQKWNEFTLVGISLNQTTIVCKNDNGFSFYKSTNLKFVNLRIIKCGFEFTTTSVNLTSAGRSKKTSFLKSKTGMLFNLCSNLTFEGVHISHSKGTGITIYNTGGYNYFSHCYIYRNNHNGLGVQPFFPGGGGIVIETSHCYPGDTSCNDSISIVRKTRRASYVLQNCKFKLNQAYRNKVLMSSFPHGTSHTDLGNGGSLAVNLKGRAYNNTVVVRKCTFENSASESGGALHLSFGDTSINNSVSICCGTIFRSNNHQRSTVTHHTIGGGVKITMLSFPKKESQELWNGYVSEVYGNSVNFKDTYFAYNFATWGGAVSFTTTSDDPHQLLFNSLHFLRCNFSYNQATLSSAAVDISAWKPVVKDNNRQYMIPVIEDCRFSHNQVHFHDIGTQAVGYGIVFVRGVPTEFCGANIFFGNIDTPLVIINALVKIAHHSVLKFSYNHGLQGGALAFFGDAYMVVGEGTQIVFKSNSVGELGYGLGGAVYVVRYINQDRREWQDCFFQYYKYGIPPKEWNATFVFSNNTANNEFNSIYATSVKQCWWPKYSITNDVPVNKGRAFCDKNTWVFNGEGRNCSNEIFTAPGHIEMKHRKLDVIPGWTIDLNVSASDDYNHSTETPLLASPQTHYSNRTTNTLTVSNTTRYILDNKIVIYGLPGEKGQSLSLSIPYPRLIATTLKINVLDCPVGFVPKYCSNPIVFGQVCDCVCIASIPGISCLNTTKKITVSKYHCISKVPNLNTSENITAVAKCPYNLYKITLAGITLSNLSQQICGNFNRIGYLCTDCQSDYGISINTYSYRCVKCTEKLKYNWLFFILLEFGPVTIACFIIVLFGISVASPYMNGFVFFAQIVSVKDFYNSFGWIMGVDSINPSLSKPVTLLYGIWNLDFFREFIDICLHPKLNTLNVLLINYIKAFHPMIVLLVCYACIKLYDRNIRIMRIIWTPFRYCVKIVRGNSNSTTFIVDAFTTLFILSYTKILYISFPLVATVTVYNVTDDNQVIWSRFFYYFHPVVAIHSKSFFYFFIGVVTLVIFVGIPPLLLLFYSCSLFRTQVRIRNTRLQIALKIFGDSFLGGYKDGTDGRVDCRWFGSVYLIFRVIIFVVYICQMDWAGQYLTQQILCTLGILLFVIVRPYKVDFFNFLDITFFILLSILNSLSTYTSQFVEPNSVSELNRGVFYLNYILLFLPYVYLTLLLLYLVSFKRLKNVTRQPKKMTRVDGEEVGNNNSDHSSAQNDPGGSDNDEFPDRFLHPDNYDACNLLPGRYAKKTLEQKTESIKTDFSRNAKDTRNKAEYGSINQ